KSSGGSDAFVTKLNPDGSSLLFSTYLGGSAADSASAIVLDSSGNAYVAGNTLADDFPTRAPFQSAHAGGWDAFVTKFSPNGALLFSTYFGGATDDQAQGIAVDASGNFYLTGFTWSTNFPVKNAAKQYNPGGGDVFISKFSPDGSSLVWSTFLGGTGREVAGGIALDSSPNVYVAGTTHPRHFPAATPFQPPNLNPPLPNSPAPAAT